MVWPARHQQHHRRQGQVRVLEEGGVQVALQVVDAHERDPPRQGVAPWPRSRRRAASRSGRGRWWRPRRRGLRRHGVGDVQGLGDDRREEVDMGPAGDLGHHAAEAGVQVGSGWTPPSSGPSGRPRPPPPPSRRRTSRWQGLATPAAARAPGSRRRWCRGSRPRSRPAARRSGRCRCRGPTSRGRPRWSRRSSSCGRRRSRIRSGGTWPERRRWRPGPPGSGAGPRGRPTPGPG